MKRTPYEEGFKAWGSGQGTTANPYPKADGNDSPYWQWYFGWRQADREDGTVV